MLDVRRENDPEILRHACLAYEKALEQLSAKVRELSQRLADIEGLSSAQIDLGLPDIKVLVGDALGTKDTSDRQDKRPEEEPPSLGRKQRRGHGPTQQQDLPIQPFHHTFERLPPCSVCGGKMEEMAGQYEESEEITVSEVSFQIAFHRRQKYRCRCNSNILTAPGPPKLIPGGRYSVDFAVHSAIGKFCDHLPLERQVRRMARHGLDITSQTLWDQHAALAKHCEATWHRLHEEVLGQQVLHVDETSWRVWGEKRTPKWTLFGLTSPRLAVYEIAGSKSAATARRILEGFRGALVVDGFAIYPIVAALEKQIKIAHCWAHADRKFKDGLDPPEAVREIRALIHQLYEIERTAPSDGPFPGTEADQARRAQVRAVESAPLVQEIRRWAYAQGGLRRSAFGKAVAYLLKHWEGLTRFLDDPRIPLDNNAAERALRGPVVGRKNFYGNRSRHGAKVAAILYSLIETAKLAGVDPAEYLRKTALTAIENPGSTVLPR